MTLDEFMSLINSYSPGDDIWNAYRRNPYNEGLAAFVMSEIKATFDPDASVNTQIETARHALLKAVRQLVDLADGIGDAQVNIAEEEVP